MAYETLAETTNVVRTNEVIGVKVINSVKENLGKIYEIVLDKYSGQTLYLVLESGSFLGMGGKLFAIPWNSIHYDQEEEAFVLNVSKDRLKQAPGFDKDHWPDMAQKTYSETIISFYGTDNLKR